MFYFIFLSEFHSRFSLVLNRHSEVPFGTPCFYFAYYPRFFENCKQKKAFENSKTELKMI
jgi:hypothetical protein